MSGAVSSHCHGHIDNLQLLDREATLLGTGKCPLYNYDSGMNRAPGPSPLVENVYFEIHFIYVPKFQNVVFTVKGCYTGHFTMSSFVNVNNDIEENCRSRSILGIVNQQALRTRSCVLRIFSYS